MALKRTRKPFYGKAETRIEQAAVDAMRSGDRERAGELFKSSEAMQERRVLNAMRNYGRRVRQVRIAPRTRFTSE